MHCMEKLLTIQRIGRDSLREREDQTTKLDIRQTAGLSFSDINLSRNLYGGSSSDQIHLY